MHGKTDQIHHDQRGLFRGLASPITATRYHSLIIDPASLSEEFEVTAWSTAPDASREIMGIRHREYTLFGLQFHPESFLTEDGGTILSQFLSAAV
jgi:anthranilate synthase/aminodeoxychorismate synthase-like glutamine amidotransferase